MPLQLNDEQLASFELLTGIDPSQLNDVLVAYLKSISGSDSNDPQDLWYATLTGLGYTGAVQDMQLEYWADITGTTGQWNDLYYQWLIDTGGAFGPNVNIVLASGGSCGFQPPTTTDCTAVGTYTANDSGFTNPADTWLWTIEPPVVGVDLTDATLKTCTVTTPTSDTSLTFNLKVVATDSVSTDNAERVTAFTQKHTDTNVAPEYVGPNIAQQFITQGVAINPIETFGLYTGTNLVFTLEGTWPVALVIDAGPNTPNAGQITGTATDPAADYDNLFIRATNSNGFADSFPFTVTVLANAVAPVFDAGPVPDQLWQEGEVIFQFAMSQFFSGTLPITYTIDSGALPDGLTMSSAGQINGTPTTEGTGSLVVRATNGSGTDVTNNWGWTIWEAIQTTTIPAQVFPLNELYTHDYSQYFTGTISAVGGYALGGPWPAGFAIDDNGVVTGTSTVLGPTAGLTVSADNIYETPVVSNVFSAETADEILPAFHALTPDETTYEMLGVKIGTGGLTTTHTADLYAPDVDGVYRNYPANTPVWSGGRTVTNDLNFSEDWTQTGSTSGVTTSTSSIEFTAGTGFCYKQMITGAVSRSNGVRLRCRITLSSADMTSCGIRLDTGAATNFISAPLSGTPVTYSFEVTTIGANCQFGIENRGAFGGSGELGTINIADAQVEFIPTDSTQNAPSEYHGPTASSVRIPPAVFANANGNTVLNNVVTEAVGAPLAEIPYLQYYPAATSTGLYSRDLTQAAAWEIISSCEVAYTQTGITGEPNTGSLVSDNQAALKCAMRQDGINTLSTIAWHTAKIWIKKDTDQTRFPEAFWNLRLSPSFKNINQQINTQTGALSTRASTGNVDSEVIDDGDWWIWLLSVENSVPDSGPWRMEIFPARGNTLGGDDADAEGSIIIGQVEIYEGKTIAQVRGLGPIFTTTAAVATDATVYTFDIANHEGESSAYYLESFVTWGSTDTIYENRGHVFSAGENARLIQHTSGTIIRSYDSNAWMTHSPVPAYSADTFVQHGLVYKLSENKRTHNFNGSYNTETTTVGYGTVEASLYLCRRTDHQPQGYRNFRRYDITSYQNGKDIIDDLMIDTITMTAGTSGPRQGYETAVMGTLVPDNPFGFTINELSEQSNDIVLVVDGIQLQTIFETIEIDGVVLTMLAATSFVTGGGISTWTFDNTTINLISTTVYPVKVQVGQ